MPQLKFPSGLDEILKFYVYVYRDPRNNEPFYVGMGNGNRCFSHIDENRDCPKVTRIAAIHESGNKPHIEILRYGLTREEASLVEASSIDLLGIPPLTNEQRGSHGHSAGSVFAEELIEIHKAKPVEIVEKVILFKISRLYRSNMTADELYEATRAAWTLGSRRERAEFGIAVYQGIAKEVYRIDVKSWRKAKGLPFRTRDSSEFGADKWAFEGSIAASQIRERYRGFSVKNYLANPQQTVRYVNC